MAEEQLEKLHLEGVAEVEAVHRLLAGFLDGGSTADPVEMATSAHSRLTRSLQVWNKLKYEILETTVHGFRVEYRCILMFLLMK